MSAQPIELFVFDHERAGATFYARRMLQMAQLPIPKQHVTKMTEPTRGRYLMLLSMPGSAQDAHAKSEADALSAIRWIIAKNPGVPINVYFFIDPDFIDQIRPLYAPNVTEKPPLGVE